MLIQVGDCKENILQTDRAVVFPKVTTQLPEFEVIILYECAHKRHKQCTNKYQKQEKSTALGRSAIYKITGKGGT